jgi:hypothetical protein
MAIVFEIVCPKPTSVVSASAEHNVVPELNCVLFDPTNAISELQDPLLSPVEVFKGCAGFELQFSEKINVSAKTSRVFWKARLPTILEIGRFEIGKNTQVKKLEKIRKNNVIRLTIYMYILP